MKQLGPLIATKWLSTGEIEILSIFVFIVHEAWLVSPFTISIYTNLFSGGSVKHNKNLEWSSEENAKAE